MTTAASLWLTATVGIAAGAGRLGLALVSTIAAFILLTLGGRIEHWLIEKGK